MTLQIMDSEKRKRLYRRSGYLLPNMITTLSMFLAFLSMVWSIQGRFEASCMAILFSALMDGLDGKVARLTHTASEFGVQYDSLADAVAFGFAPAILLWQWQLSTFGRLGVAVAFFYAACGVLRLARFNVSAASGSKRFFVGLPIPAGACTVVTFVYFSTLLPEFLTGAIAYMTLLLSVCAGLLMVSRVRYFSFKEYDFLRAHPIRSMVTFFFLLGLVASLPRLFGFLFCTAYIIGGLVYTYILVPRRDRQLLRVLAQQGD